MKEEEGKRDKGKDKHRSLKSHGLWLGLTHRLGVCPDLGGWFGALGWADPAPPTLCRWRAELSAGAPSGCASAEFSTRGARICEWRAMLASLARVSALRRTGLFSRRGGGTGLWTGRPQSGTLRNSVQAAKETPVPAFPLRRQSAERCAFLSIL